MKMSNKSKEEAIASLLLFAKRATENWLKAHPDSKETEPVFYLQRGGDVQKSHDLNQLAVQSGDNRLLLASPDLSETLAIATLACSDGCWIVKVFE